MKNVEKPSGIKKKKEKKRNIDKSFFPSKLRGFTVSIFAVDQLDEDLEKQVSFTSVETDDYSISMRRYGLEKPTHPKVMLVNLRPRVGQKKNCPFKVSPSQIVSVGP